MTDEAANEGLKRKADEALAPAQAEAPPPAAMAAVEVVEGLGIIAQPEAEVPPPCPPPAVADALNAAGKSSS